jgi:predicted MPP superfamily phosphohydrolase
MKRDDHRLPEPTPELAAKLEERLGRLFVRQRLGVERDHAASVHRRNVFHLKGWMTHPFVIRNSLKLVGLYRRGERNAQDVKVRRHDVCSPILPQAFDGFTILHLSDLHADISVRAMARLAELLPGLDYDICVMTGDYRGDTFGPFADALELMAGIRRQLKDSVYGVFGNHDTLLMLPALEAMGIRMLMNEAATIRRGGATLWLAGVDDGHFYRTDDVAAAAADIPSEAFSILLSHTPELYGEVAETGFDLMLSGHTHGGQICLPGSVAVTLEAKGLPRTMGSGSWRHGDMTGYTSAGAGTCVLPVRLNCLPEVTLHRLVRA